MQILGTVNYQHGKLFLLSGNYYLQFIFELYKVGIFVLFKFENELEIIIGDIS